MGAFLLSINDVVDDKYKVKFRIKNTENYQSYRVYYNEDSDPLLLKVLINNLNIDYEAVLSLSHPNFLPIKEIGKVTICGVDYHYLISEYNGGEELDKKIDREGACSLVEAKDIILGLLNLIRYLYYKKDMFIFDIKFNDIIPVSIRNNYIVKFHNVEYIKVISRLDDIQKTFRLIGELYFYLLTGEYLKSYNDFDLYEHISNKVENIILRAMSAPSFIPFKNVDEFIQEIYFDKEYYQTHRKIKFNKEVKNNNGALIGFSAIAGMEDLKSLVKVDIIDALNQKEKYKRYGITIPNGMLLYGPPGCGKTFFAEKIAEEIGAKFYQLKPSDIQSKWVNASQENVKDLFNDARENAPSIIFIDELDAIVPSRDTDNISHMNTSIVNEFLAQMNNCSEDSIFIIGATNRPSAIDRAVLRSGRLDKHIYLPPPDLEARRKMFELYLSKRPIEKDIDYIQLAKNTNNFVSSDIKFLCDEASRTALKMDTNISQKILLSTISNNKSSISIEELEEYKKIQRNFSGNSIRRIGF